VRDEAEHKRDSEADGPGARRCRDAEGVRDEAELRVVDDAAAAAEEAAHAIAEAARAGGHIGLSGGSGPRAAYERSAILQPDWGRVELWWIDERCVPPDDGRSNYRTIRESLLDGLARPPQLHRVRGELPAPEAADEYDGALDGVTLSLALMGIGPDGHTASLFPDAPSLDVTERRAVAADAGLEPFVPRVTLTRPMLGAAETMVYLATGEGKAEAVARAFGEPPSPATPASLVRGARTVAILDRSAASRLEAK
jgi:6-phosphogluconolactonase